MKQADNRILKELRAIGSAFGVGSGAPAGGGSAAIAMALEEMTDGTNWLGMYRAGGSNVDGNPNKIIVQRYPPDRIANSTALATGTARFCAFYLPKQKPITGIKWFQGAAGSLFTPANSNHCGLYSWAPGQANITQVALSASNNALWSTFGTSQYGNVNFATPYLAPAGIYYGAFLFNGTGGTAPGLGAYNIFIANAMGGTLSMFADVNFNLVATKNAETALQSTYALSGLTQATTSGYQTWCALY